MIRIDSLRPAAGSRHRRKVVGRGEGSGHGGKGSTRGFKGQTARSGDAHMKPGFEGGQIPLLRRLPKRGFRRTAFQTPISLVNVGDLEARFEAGSTVGPEDLKRLRLVRPGRPVKVLGNGEIAKALTVTADAFSASARKKIEAAGGACRAVKAPPPAQA